MLKFYYKDILSFVYFKIFITIYVICSNQFDYSKTPQTVNLGRIFYRKPITSKIFNYSQGDLAAAVQDVYGVVAEKDIAPPVFVVTTTISNTPTTSPVIGS